MQENKDLTMISNSDLFLEYNSTPAKEFKRRAELRSEIDRRIVSERKKSRVLEPLREAGNRREQALNEVAFLLGKLDPELLWVVYTTPKGKLGYTRVGDALFASK